MNLARVSGSVFSRTLLFGVALAGVLVVLASGRAETGSGSQSADYPHGDFEGECSDCHAPDTWSIAVIDEDFDHAAFGFPLEGAHREAACRTCHASLDFTKTVAACVDCHQDVHDGELGIDCSGCHTARSFTERSRMEKEHLLTRFPLTGAHTSLDCSECHGGSGSDHLTFVKTPTECEVCHTTDYENTTDPDHFTLGFPLDCAGCHTTQAWEGVAFDHAATEFPLTGAHVPLDCQSCHGDGVYNGKATECAVCHQDDYDTTTEPDHFAAGFSLDCTTCHGTASWTPASFDHNLSDFPLTGAHSALPCMDCHGDGVYNEKPTECAACHQDDYDATTDPDHAAAQFPLDCTTCHDTVQWDGATFVHTWFPIYTGTHANEWNACMDCHTSAQDFAQFSCLGCHPHSDKAKTDGDHNEENGYQYESLACYSCHPQGTH